MSQYFDPPPSDQIDPSAYAIIQRGVYFDVTANGALVGFGFLTEGAAREWIGNVVKARSWRDGCFYLDDGAAFMERYSIDEPALGPLPAAGAA